MRLVVQRVKKCSVQIDGITSSSIESGLLAYLGIERGDKREDLEYLARKLLGLRIFEDSRGKMNLSVQDQKKEIMIISQFTLLGDTRKGNRPSYNNAEDPEKAKILYLDFIDKIRSSGIKTGNGSFQTHMEISYINDGPVTILLDSNKNF